MANADDLRAQLLVAELEQKLVIAKQSDDIDPAELRHVKERLRLARQKYREEYRTVALDDTTAEPETIRLRATVGGD